MFQKQNKAFTLVELIVVITILSIMGTIAFISLGGYGGLARESARLADLNTISRAMGLHHVENNIYPDTASGTTVTYSGSILWTQGYFTGSVGLELKKIPQIPVDPLMGTPYIYSVTHNRQEFQIAGGGERGGALSYTSLVPETYASFSKAIVKGNYNGSMIGKQIDNSMYIFGVPSIITTQEESSVTINNVYQNRGFVLDGFGALPSGLKLPGQESSLIDFPVGTVNTDTPVLFSGSTQELATSTGILNLTQKVHDLYVSTPLTQVEQIQKFTETDPSTVDDKNMLVSKVADYLSNTSTISPVLDNMQLQDTLANTAESPPDTLLTTYFGSGSQYTKNWLTNACNPNEMTVINVTPGTDTLPATLSGNTLYKLEADTYFTTRSIIASTCSAVIGETGQTIIKKGGTTIFNSFLRTFNSQNIIFSDIMVEGGNIALQGSSNNTINNVSSYNNTIGISLNSSLNNTINNVSSYNNTLAGFILTSSSINNILSNIKSYNNTNNGIQVSGSSSNNTFLNVLSYNNNATTNNNYSGISVSTSSINNTFNNVISFNNYNGISFSSASNNTLNNVLSYNNTNNGILISATSTNNIFNNVASYNNTTGIFFQPSGQLYSSGNTFFGFLKVFGNTSVNISYAGFSTGIENIVGWSSGISETIGTFSQDWAIIPSVSGWNFSTRGRQNLTFNEPIIYTYGSNIPFQIQGVTYFEGVIKSYGTNNTEYNITKRIGQW